MKSTVLIACLLALSTACELKELRVQNNCIIEENGIIFDLCLLSNATQDYELAYKQGDQDRTVTFNFFRNLVDECEAQGSYAATWWMDGEDSKCAVHSTAQGQSGAEFKNVTLLNADANDNSTHIQIEYLTDTTCAKNEDKKNGLIYEFQCNENIEENFFSLDPASVADDDCVPKIVVSSKHGCKKLDINALWRWCEANWWILAIVLIVGGGFEWVLGQKMFKPTLFITGTLSVLTIVMFFFYAWVLPYSTASWLVWLIGAIGLILGLVAGFFLAKLAKIGIAALGAWVGVILALIIHEAFLYATHS